MPTPKHIEASLANVKDERTFLQGLLSGTLAWPIDEAATRTEDVTYEWPEADLRARNLSRKVAEGRIKQFVPSADCPWGIFLIEFTDDAPFKDDAAGRGMTGTLRDILRGLVPSKRKNSRLASFKREHLLFICTHDYTSFRFAYFKDPGESFKTPQLASFGWTLGGAVKTVARYNLPNLEWPPDGTDPKDWIAQWTRAFDVERITKDFFEQFTKRHDDFLTSVEGIPDERERRWFVSALLNRLMFVYFLQKKGFIDGGGEAGRRYLEQKLEESRDALGNDTYYDGFLKHLFFEGFAKPPKFRKPHKGIPLGEVKYLNGGLFLKHPVEQKQEDAKREIKVPDAPFQRLFDLFSRYSWNLDDTPGGSDNEINPDVLGYIFEKYINYTTSKQKEFGAFYTRPEITDYLCEKTIHRLILDGVNTPGSPAAGLPKRDFDTVGQMLSKMDDGLATRLLDEVLPGLSLLDPACGSGAFLIAAMKAMVDVYTGVFGWVRMSGSPTLKARVKQVESDHPSLLYYIKKQIITQNIYGVDIMEEATEIARLRLFLTLVASADTVDQLEPLPNIDFNVLSGNSLIGLLHVDEGDFDARGRERSMFAEQYRALLNRRNVLLRAYKDAATYDEGLTGRRDEIRKAAEAASQQLNDILLAEMHDLGVQYHVLGWDPKKKDTKVNKKRSVTPTDIDRLRPFHWAYMFDKVVADRGGFDAIITNPPWEIFKPNGKEFFQNHSDLVTRKKMSIHEFEDEQEKMLEDEDVRDKWLEYCEEFPPLSAYYRSAQQYRNQISVVNGKKAGTDINLYKLFVEQCYNLLRPGGLCGIVIPSGIYTDLGSKQLREMLFGKTTVTGLVGFENRRKVFDDVDSRFKFVVLTFQKKGDTKRFPAAFMRHDVGELRRFPDGPDPESRGQVMIDVATARRLAPDSLSIMEFKSPLDVAIAEKMLRFPMLGSEGEGGWNLRLTAEFHMTNDANKPDGSRLFLDKPSKGRLPLYEGKMIWQFDHRYAEPRYWIEEKAGRKQLLGRSEDSGQVLDYQAFRLGFRDIAANTNERTLVSAIIPPTFHGNKIPTVCIYGENGRRLIGDVEQTYLLGLWNSFVIDYIIRMRVTTTLNFFYILQLTAPQYNPENQSHRAIVERAAQLTCTTEEYEPFAKALGIKGLRCREISDRERSALRSEVDGLVAHLYGLTEDEFAHVLRQFPIVPEPVKTDAINAYRDVQRGLIT